MKSMKYFSVATMFSLMLMALIPQQGIAGPMLMAAEGYIYGQLSRIHQDKTTTRAFVGEVSLGHDSQLLIGANGPSINSWQFCFEKEQYEEIKKFIGKNVIVEFVFPKRNSLLSCPSINEFQEIYPVYQDLVWEQKHYIGNIHASDPEVSWGIEYGRITNLTKDLRMNRVYYMTLQVGASGNKFHHFMIDDHDLYEFAISVLRNAAMIKVGYSDRRSYGNRFGFGSRSIVSEIEIIDQTSDMQSEWHCLSDC